MITIRRAAERGTTSVDWLLSRHTFSFGYYRDDDHMGYRTLRVINDDIVEPGQGFGTHGHRDMEIISIVLEGELEHRDSLGHGEVLRPGEVQVMSAGRGIRHSEFNPSSSASAHFLQIWILPDRHSAEPRYDQRQYDTKGAPNTLVRIAGPAGSGADRALPINQDANVYLLRLDAGHELHHQAPAGRGVWVQVYHGSLTVNGETLREGDGAACDDISELTLTGLAEGAEAVVFDLR